MFTMLPAVPTVGGWEGLTFSLPGHCRLSLKGRQENEH